MKRAIDGIGHWWHGEYIPYENDPDSLVIVVGGYQKRHWTASALHLIWEFYLEHWKWVWGTGLAIIAITVSA